MKGLSIFSRKKVKNEQDKHGDALQNEKDPGSLETMSAEMTSLKSRLLSKEVEVQTLKDTVAQKDEEINRLKNTLRVRDLKVDVPRADVESVSGKFGTFLSITSPERSKNEIKHEKEPGEEEMWGVARKLCFQPIFIPAIPGPPLQSYLSIAESDLVGALCSITPSEQSAPEGSVDQIPGYEKTRR